MNTRGRYDLFGGAASPLSLLAGAGLLIIASGRIVSAMICCMALVWIGVCATLASAVSPRVFPEQGQGREAVLVCAASLAALLFFFVLWLADPVLAMESSFFIALCPAFLLNADFARRTAGTDILELVFMAVSEALITGGLIAAVALIREPLGSGSISMPGLGLVEFAREAPFAFLEASSGVLILLGYGAAACRHFLGNRTGEGS